MLNNILMFRTTFIYIFPCYLSWKIYIFLSWYSSSSLLIAPQKKKGGLATKGQFHLLHLLRYSPLTSWTERLLWDNLCKIDYPLRFFIPLHSTIMQNLSKAFFIYENSLSAVSILNSESLTININLSTVKILIYHLIYYPIY